MQHSPGPGPGPSSPGIEQQSPASSLTQQPQLRHSAGPRLPHPPQNPRVLPQSVPPCLPPRQRAAPQPHPPPACSLGGSALPRETPCKHRPCCSAPAAPGGRADCCATAATSVRYHKDRRRSDLEPCDHWGRLGRVLQSCAGHMLPSTHLRHLMELKSPPAPGAVVSLSPPPGKAPSGSGARSAAPTSGAELESLAAFMKLSTEAVIWSRGLPDFPAMLLLSPTCRHEAKG